MDVVEESAAACGLASGPDSAALVLEENSGGPLRKPHRLEKRLAELESQNDELRQHLAALQEVESRYRSLAENIPDVVYSLSEQGVILTVNKAVAAYGYAPEELIGRTFLDLIHPEDRERVVNSYFEVVAVGKDYIRTQQFRILTRSGEVRWFEANCAIRFTSQGKFILQEGVCRDISERMQIQNTLLRVQEDLEEQIKGRTGELQQANAILQQEIIERRQMEKSLREHEADLELEKANLEESNTTLRALLKRRDVDRHELEERVMYNIKELILPYLDKLRQLGRGERQKAYLSILEANLNDITSNFSRRLSLEFYRLTPSEVKVASFIRQGKRNRAIADLMQLSTRTVEAYRQSIRRKLRIANKKVNLHTFLTSVG